MKTVLYIILLSGVMHESHGQSRFVATVLGDLALSVEYRPAIRQWDTVLVGAVPRIFPREMEVSGIPGIVDVPTESFLVALPPNTMPAIEEVVTIPGATRIRAKLAPIPEITVADDSLKTITRHFPAVFTYAPRVFESSNAKVVHVFRWRGYTLARIEVKPIGYDPATETLIEYSSVRLKIRFESPTVDHSPVSGDPHFDGIFQSFVVNAEQAKAWRFASSGLAVAAADSSKDWFSSLGVYLKIPIAQDGLFVVSYADVSATLTTNGPFFDHRVALYYKGKRIQPLITGESDGEFGLGDSLVFFGLRLRNSDGTPDGSSDTSAYWLSVDSDSATTLPIDPAYGLVTDTIKAFRHTLRLEKDSIYYFGNAPANNTSGEVLGEGWYWARLFASQSIAFPFAVPNPDTTTLPLSISGRFHSPVQGQATPSHKLELRLNGSLIGAIEFNNNRDTTFALNFSAPLIQVGTNTLTVSSVPTAAALNEVYIDWLGIEVEERAIAVSDTLMLKPDESLLGQIALFPVSGFSTPMITALRLGPDGQMEKSLTGTVTGSGPYTKTFSDTVLSGRTYVVVGTNRYLAVSGAKQKQFLDLRSNAAGADYVIITHRELSSAANQLSAYRSQQGIGRTAVVFVDDIYDEFNFGHQSPYAIRSFLRAADSLWSDPNPSYVVLFGDANWDAKNNLGSARRNLVPSFGNPVSDAFYAASAFDGLLPERYIGRIPVQTPQQGAQFVSHVMTYEAQPLSVWNKTFLFMSAGYTASEAVRFQSFSDGLIASYVEASPVTGFGSRIYRPPSNVIEFDVNDSVHSIIQNGALWMNFYGHAGTEIWANGISQPDQLANTSGKRHLISDISCSTARFAEPSIEAFGERMVLGDEGGAIGYIGSSGFGFESPLRVLADEMFKRVSQDTLREFGKMLLAAKTRLWTLGTGSLLNRQALDQFTLLGDPATRLALAVEPDYAVDDTKIHVVPEQPTESDSVRIHIPVSNYGLRGADTVKVRINHEYQSLQSQLPTTQLGPVGAGDTLVIGSPLFQQPGLHELQVSVDFDMQLDEVNESNNMSAFSFFVLSQQLLPLQPLPLSMHHPDSVLLMVQNPNQSGAAAWSAFFEVDTTADFSGASVVRSPGIPQGVYKSQWSIPANILLDSALYHWRGRLSSGTDSTNWIGGTFWTRLVKRDEWHQEGSMLVDVNTTENVVEENSARLIHDDKPITLYSAGFDAGDSASIYVDGQNISIGFTERGYNVAVLNPATAAVEQFGAFRLYSDSPDTSLAEPLIQFLTNIPEGSIVLMAIADEGAVNKTERLNQAIESMGSAMIRSLGFRSSWALIGKKGAAIGSVPEILKAAGAGPATLTDTLLFAATSGTVTTPFIGPASGWNAVSLIADTSDPGTHISFDLIRRHNSGPIDTVTGVPSGTTLLGSFVSPSVREVRLLARLSSDVPGISPGLLAWSVSFDPPSELGLNYQAVLIDRDTVLEGEPVTLTAAIQNTGSAPASNVGARVSYSGVVLDSARVSVPPGEAIQLLVVPTAGFSGRPVFVVEIDPDDEIPELFEANNIFSFSVQVQGDTISPMFQVSFDGMTIFDNDYVRPEPEIRISIRDNSPLPITDPNSVVLRLNNRRITLGSAPDSLFETLTGSEKARVTFRPTLAKGDYLLSVQVLDASGNPADSMEYEIRFKVETDLRLLNVFNFPNPFSTETAFTFHLTGTGVAEEVNLRVYTTAGRLIYERRLMPGEVNIGFNRIPWDGRDQNGDPVANGVYFYKVSALQDGKRVEVVEKLARVR